MTEVKYDSHGNRLFRGEKERRDGRYEYRYTDRFGDRHSVYAYRLHQLRMEEVKITMKEHNGIMFDFRQVTLNDMFEIWIEGKAALKTTTLRGYRQIYDSFLRKTLGKRMVEEIRTADVKAFYLSLKNERRVSTETICRIQNVLFQIFQNAVETDVIWKNPADRATKEIKRAHSKHTSTRIGLTEAEADVLTGYIYKTPGFMNWYPVIYVMIHTGLRLGEIVSLRWCDVNLQKKCLEVNHTASYYAENGEKARYHFSEGAKTAAGIRTVPFDRRVREAFEMERDILDRKKVTCVEEIDGYTDFVFLNRFGRMFDPGAINKALTRIVVSYNCYIEGNAAEEDMALPHLSCHILRHTYARILCENGVNVKVMQMLLGHKDISTTMDIYTSISREFAFKEYAEKMDKE